MIEIVKGKKFISMIRGGKMKLKEYFSKQRVMMGGVILTIFCIGTVGMAYVTKQDRIKQENEVMEIRLPIDEKGQELKDTNVNHTDETAVIEKIGDYKVILEGEKPSEAILTMEQAAQVGAKHIYETSDVGLEGCEIKMSYMPLEGTTEKGIWQGIVDISETRYFTFEVGDTSGRAMESKEYYKEAGEQAWRTKTANGMITQRIEEKNLPQFTNIDIDIEGGMDIDILYGDQYDLYIEWSGEDYKVNYEIKDDTIYIKDLPAPNYNRNKNSYQNMSNSLILRIPKGVDFENMRISNNTGYTKITSMSGKKVDLESNTGEIELKGIGSDKIKIVNNTGFTELTSISAEQINLVSNTGAIEVKRCDIGSLSGKDINTGSVSIDSSKINTIKLGVQTGAIEIKNVQSDTMNLETQTGNIYLGSGLKGDITAHTAMGQITIKEKDNSECTYHISNQLLLL